MKKLFCMFVVLLAAIGLGFLIHKDPGYAMVSYGNWVIATSVWVAIIIFVLAFFILYFLIRLIKNTFAIPAMMHRRRLFINAQKYQKYMACGITDIAAGDFKKAEKVFLKLSRLNNSYVNFLLAAQAAQAQHAFDRRDLYLKNALALDQEAHFAILLTQAQFLMQSDECDAALVIFKTLLKQAPKNNLILNGLKMIYFKTHQWEALKLLESQLKKQKLLSQEEMNQIRTSVMVAEEGVT